MKSLNDLLAKLDQIDSYTLTPTPNGVVFTSNYVEAQHPRLGGKWVDKSKMPNGGETILGRRPETPPPVSRMPTSPMFDKELAKEEKVLRPSSQPPKPMPAPSPTPQSAFQTPEQHKAFKDKAKMLDAGAPIHKPGEPIPPAGYGYWVSPSGHYHPVNTHQDHGLQALKIMKWRGEKLPSGVDATRHMINQGYARVIHDDRMGTQIELGKGHRQNLHQHLLPLIKHSLNNGHHVSVESVGKDRRFLKGQASDNGRRVDRWMLAPDQDYSATH